MSEVQRATAQASTSMAKAARSGGVLFVHRFGATLNAHVHLHLCMLDGGRRGKPGWLPHTAKIQLESAGRCPPTALPPCFYRIHTAATTHSAATGCWFRRSARSARGRAGKSLCQALLWPATPVTAICARATSVPTARTIPPTAAYMSLKMIFLHCWQRIAALRTSQRPGCCARSQTGRRLTRDGVVVTGVRVCSHREGPRRTCFLVPGQLATTPQPSGPSQSARYPRH